MSTQDLDSQIYKLQLESVLQTTEEVLTRLQKNDSDHAVMLADDFKQSLCNMREDERADAVKNVSLWIQTHADGYTGQVFDLLGIVYEAAPAISDGIKETIIYQCLQKAAKAATADDITRRDELILAAARMLTDAHPLVVQRWRKEFSRLVGVDAKTFSALLKSARTSENDLAAESLGLKAEPRNKARYITTDTAGDMDSLPYNLTDLGNAERLAAWDGDKLRHVEAWGWLVWNDKRWERNRGAAARLAKEAVRMIYKEAANGRDVDERNDIASWAMKSESEHRINAMLALAESEAAMEARPEIFDADPMLLNCTNGTLDLRTGELHAHDPADRLTRLSGADFNPGGTCPTWEAFLSRVMGGQQTLIDFLRRAVGYSLTGDTGEQCLFFCYGRGANGKSTFLETIRALSGEYAQTTEFETLLAKRNASGGANPDIARMSGVRFITAIEAGEGRRLNESVIKALTGGDRVTARHLYHDHFEFHPQFKLWLAANHKPTVKGTDEAIWRRIRLIPFTVTIPEQERDPKMAAKLRAELLGILAWAVRGCLEWQAEGLGTPDEVRVATEQYRAEQDVLAAFLEECCIVKPEAEARAGKLLEAFKAWTGESIDAKEFRQKLTERGFTQQHTKRGNVWQGIGLIDLLSGEG